jgi:hypothetical protein
MRSKRLAYVVPYLLDFRPSDFHGPPIQSQAQAVSRNKKLELVLSNGFAPANKV